MRRVISHFEKLFYGVLLAWVLAMSANQGIVFAAPGVSNYLSYQGRLTDTSGNPLGGAGTNYCFSFSVFDASSAGTKLWPTTATTTSILSVANGVFGASIGDVSTVNFSANDTQYLNVDVAAQVGGTCTGVSWEALTPRQKLDSVAYARTAHDLYGGDAQIGTGAGVASGQNLLKLDVKTVADTVGASGCSPNGALWYNSGNARTFVCDNNLYQVIGSAITNQFFNVTGPTTAIKTFTFPDASATVLTSNAAVTAIQGGTGQTTYAVGDLLYASATNVLSKLTKGTANQVLSMDGTGTNVTWATPTGGGGSPGGATTQIQFNNAGAFGGDADFTWNNTTKDLVLGGIDTGITLNGITNEPAAPAVGDLHIYSKAVAGRMVPKWKAPSGVDTSFQASFGFNRVAMVAPAGTGTTVPQVWGTTVTSVGTVGHPALASTSFLTATRRFTLTSAATAGSLVSHRQGALMAWRGNAAGLGGFFFTIRFNLTTLAAGNRAFVGLADVVTAPTNVDPTTSTTPGKIGMAINTNTGNWNWVNNITGTIPTVAALGASFPVNTTDLYELVIYAPPNGPSITYRVTNLSTGAQTADTTVSANIPASATFLSPLFWMTNNATASAVAMATAGWYLESDQ